MIQGCRMQVERREGYELQLVMVMAMGCQWDGTTLALKSQQPVMVSLLHPSFIIKGTIWCIVRMCFMRKIITP